VAARRFVRYKFLIAGELGVQSFVIVNTVFDFSSERSDQSLNWPSCGVAQCTNRVTFDLVGQLLQHVDFRKISIAKLHSFKHIDHPASSLATRSALTAGFVLVELCEP
jgi:hypothetical protein